MGSAKIAIVVLCTVAVTHLFLLQLQSVRYVSAPDASSTNTMHLSKDVLTQPQQHLQPQQKQKQQQQQPKPLPTSSKFSNGMDFFEAVQKCADKSSIILTQLDRPYRMYTHPRGSDIWVSDSVLNSNGDPSVMFESTVRSAMLSALANKKDAVILDIGANIGIHSVFLAAKGYEVHSFEPFKKNFELLQCSAVMNQFDPSRFRINNYGLSEKESSSCMSVATNNFGGAWIDPTKSQCDSPVVLKRLDTYLESHQVKPYLIKIDIEGHEPYALLPAKNYLRKYPPAHIFTEFAPQQMRDTKSDPMGYLQFFWDLGYKIYKIDGTLVDKDYAVGLVNSGHGVLYDLHIHF